jgi:hypothetical protein
LDVFAFIYFLYSQSVPFYSQFANYLLLIVQNIHDCSGASASRDHENKQFCDRDRLYHTEVILVAALAAKGEILTPAILSGGFWVPLATCKCFT